MLRSALSATERLYTCLVIPKPHSSLPQCLNVARAVHTTSVTGVKRDVGQQEILRDREDFERGAELADRAVTMEDLRPESLFPTGDTAAMVIEGRRFDELPIIHIKASKNNTIISITKDTGEVITHSSGGMEGFKNAKKGTNIAGQAAGIAAGEKALKKGVSTVRVCVRGIGPGRLPAIKGVQMAGVNIVSITDTTRITERGPRPRKQRRL